MKLFNENDNPELTKGSMINNQAEGDDDLEDCCSVY